jgi:hypothetical protein
MHDRFVLESFWQKKSNCACVAFIKCLLLDNTLQKAFAISRSGKNLFIALLDGRILVFSENEIRDINRQNALSFKRPRNPQNARQVKKIKQFAETCFAILVRNMQLLGFDGKEYTRQDAIDTLTKEGVSTSYFHKLLGLKRTRTTKLTRRNLQRLKKEKAALLFNDKHITVASGGYYEDFGEAVPVGTEIPVLLGQPATGWYRLAAR